MATRHRTQHGVRKTPDINARARAVRAQDLITAGWTYVAAAQELGYAGPSGVYNACQREMDRHSAVSTDHRRQLQSRRHEEVMRNTREQWLKGGDMALFALQGYQRSMDAYEKLWGLRLGDEEKKAGIPYHKTIVVEMPDGPLQLPPGGIVEE